MKYSIELIQKFLVLILVKSFNLFEKDVDYQLCPQDIDKEKLWGYVVSGENINLIKYIRELSCKESTLPVYLPLEFSTWDDDIKSILGNLPMDLVVASRAPMLLRDAKAIARIIEENFDKYTQANLGSSDPTHERRIK